MDQEQKFKIDDKVKIINYGHPMWWHKKEYEQMAKAGFTINGRKKPANILKEDDTTYWYDSSPEVVGKVGMVEKVMVVQGVPQYSINIGPGLKHAWYNEEQMELI